MSEVPVLADTRSIFRHRIENMPNQAPEPTPTTVTPPAGRLRQASPGETQEARQP